MLPFLPSTVEGMNCTFTEVFAMMKIVNLVNRFEDKTIAAKTLIKKAPLAAGDFALYLASQASSLAQAWATGAQVATKYQAMGTKQNMKRLAE